MQTSNFTKFRPGKIQSLLIVLVWVLLFTIPLLFVEYDNGVNWDHIFKIWKEYSIVFVIFILNHFVLLPYLFFKGKQKLYFSSILMLIISTSLVIFFIDTKRMKNEEFPFPPPPEFANSEMRIPPENRQDALGPRPENRLGEIGPRPENRQGDMIPPFANLFIMSILLIGFDTGLVFSTKWMQAEQNKLKIEKENIENKMAFLQNQISPHFFMNTLNNIHSLIDYDAEIAKETVISLSKLMRHILYDSQTDRISLKKELEFIRNYVELMRLRSSENIKITLDIPKDIPEKQIPPLLFTSYIENAFKYGISYQNESYININFKFSANQLTFEIENSIFDNNKPKEVGGIGIDNSRKRLDLMYADNYSLDINESDNNFKVNITIPI